MSKSVLFHLSDRLGLLSEVLALTSEASHPSEALERFVEQLAAWLNCSSAVVHVHAPDGPAIVRSGSRVGVRADGLEIAPDDSDLAAAWSSGRMIRTPDLKRQRMFAEDGDLAAAGLRSAIRGSLRMNGQEVGRFGLYAEAPDHFQRRHVQVLEWLAEPLAGICRQVGLSPNLAGNRLAKTLESAAAAAESGVLPVLRICRTSAAEMAGATGSVAVLLTGEYPPSVAVDRAGPALAGIPPWDDPDAWWSWVHGLPAGGRYQESVWQAPVMAGAIPVGAVAVSPAGGGIAPEEWQQRMRPVLAFLAALAVREQGIAAISGAARSEVSALAACVADDVGNLMTELALQADLLQGSLGVAAAALPRVEALKRLVRKGTLVGASMEEIASARVKAYGLEELATVVDRVSVHVRSYRGGRYLVINPSLGACARTLISAEPVERALTHLLLALAQHRSSEARILIRAHAQPAGESGMALWLAERGGELLGQESSLLPAFVAARLCLQRVGGDLVRMQLEPGAHALVLQIPIRT